MAETVALDSLRPQSRRQRFELLRAQMRDERSSFISHWRDLVDYIQPRRGRFFQQDTNRGDRRTKRIIDTTPTLASRNLSAGMMGGLTSPARPWFRLSVPEIELNEDSEVKFWLDDVTRRMRQVFLRSNLYQALPIMYTDLSTFGTACIFVEEDFDNVMRFFPQPIGSYMIANDDKLRVRVFFREFQMTVRQLVEKFGELDEKGMPMHFRNFSTQVKELWVSKHHDTWLWVNHVVMPNENFDPNRVESKFKKFISVYYEAGTSSTGNERFLDRNDDTFLRERGYDIFPVLAPRWEVTGGDIYGTNCPGMTALGDIRQLQLVERRLMQAISKMVNPPMKGPPELRNKNASILPGALTYLTEHDARGGFRPVHEVDPRIREMEAKQEQTRKRIKDAFYETLFLQLSQTDRREITAREVEERHEEKLIQLGTVLERINQEGLDPLVDLTFDIMNRQGLIPDPPEALRGRDLKVEYISIMATAQKLQALGGVERFAGFVSQLATAKAEVLDKIDFDQLVDEYGDIIGVPPRVIVSDDEVAAVRAERQRAAQAAQAAQNLQAGAAAAKDLSKAKLEDDSVLSRIADEVGGGQPQEEVA